MKLTFSKMRDVSDLIHSNKQQEFCDFLNSFEGDNILMKFKSILETWEYHVSPSFVISESSKKINVSLDYIIKYITTDLAAIKTISVDEFEIELQIPRKYELGDEIIPIYNILKSIRNDKVKIELDDLSLKDRQHVIDMLPAHLYTNIIQYISSDQSKILKLDNLTTFKFNFYTFDTYMFLKNIFGNYRREYFQDVVFHLSKRLGYDAIVASDLRDIEYYISKHNDEMEHQKKATPSLD